MSKLGGTIYAIGAQGTSWVKVGCTTAPVATRLKRLQTGQPFPLEVLAAVPVESDLQRIERQVHAFLAEDKRRGEWFETGIDLPTLEALIVRAVHAIQGEDDRAEHERAAREARLHADPDAERLSLEVFGERLRRRRKDQKLSQQELAKAMQIPQSWISELETGKRPHVEADTVYRFSRALDCTSDYLLGLTDAPHPRRR